jgi:hypothetical protein
MSLCPSGTFAQTSALSSHEYEIECTPMSSTEALDRLDKLIRKIYSFSTEAVPAIAMVARYAAAHESHLDNADFAPFLRVAEEAENILMPLTVRVSELLDGGEVEEASAVAAMSGVDLDTVERVDALFYRRLNELCAQMRLDVAGFDVNNVATPRAGEVATWFGGGSIAVQMYRFVTSMNRLGLIGFESLLALAASIAFGSNLSFIPMPRSFSTDVYHGVRSACGYLSVAKGNRKLVEAALNGVMRQYTKWKFGSNAGLTEAMERSFQEIDELLTSHPNIATATTAMMSFSSGRRLLENRHGRRRRRKEAPADDMVAHNLPALKGWLLMFDSFMQSKGASIVSNACSVMSFTYAGNNEKLFTKNNAYKIIDTFDWFSDWGGKGDNPGIKDNVPISPSVLTDQRLKDTVQVLDNVASGMDSFLDTLDWFKVFWGNEADAAFVRESKRRKGDMDSRVFLSEHEKEWKEAYMHYTTTPDATNVPFAEGPYGQLITLTGDGLDDVTRVEKMHEHARAAAAFLNTEILNQNDIAGKNLTSSNHSVAIVSELLKNIAQPGRTSVAVVGAKVLSVGAGYFLVPLFLSPVALGTGTAALVVKLLSGLNGLGTAMLLIGDMVDVYSQDTASITSAKNVNKEYVTEIAQLLSRGAREQLENKTVKNKDGSTTPRERIMMQVNTVATWIAVAIVKATSLAISDKEKDEPKVLAIGAELMKIFIKNNDNEVKYGDLVEKLNKLFETHAPRLYGATNTQPQDAARGMTLLLTLMGRGLVQTERFYEATDINVGIRKMLLSENVYVKNAMTDLVEANPGLLNNVNYHGPRADAIAEHGNLHSTTRDPEIAVTIPSQLYLPAVSHAFNPTNSLWLTVGNTLLFYGQTLVVGASLIGTASELYGRYVPGDDTSWRRRHAESALPLLTNELIDSELSSTSKEKINNFEYTGAVATTAAAEKKFEQAKESARALMRTLEYARQKVDNPKADTTGMAISAGLRKQFGSANPDSEELLYRVGDIFVTCYLNPKDRAATNQLERAIDAYLNVFVRIPGLGYQDAFNKRYGTDVRLSGAEIIFHGQKNLENVVSNVVNSLLTDAAVQSQYTEPLGVNILDKFKAKPFGYGGYTPFEQMQQNIDHIVGSAPKIPIVPLPNATFAGEQNTTDTMHNTTKTEKAQAQHDEGESKHQEQQKEDAEQAEVQQNMMDAAVMLLSAFVTVMAVTETLPDVSELETRAYNTELADLADAQLLATGTLAKRQRA